MAESTWRRTEYRGSLDTHGPARVSVEPDRLRVELELYRLLRMIFRRAPAPKEIMAAEVVEIELVRFRGRTRCHIVAGSGYGRREYWLSAWVLDAWSQVAPNLPGLKRSGPSSGPDDLSRD